MGKAYSRYFQDTVRRKVNVENRMEKGTCKKKQKKKKHIEKESEVCRSDTAGVVKSSAGKVIRDVWWRRGQKINVMLQRDWQF